MMMSIALRFIPILTEELEKIMKAQTARGSDFESGGLLKRVKSMVPIIVPLFVAAIEERMTLQWQWNPVVTMAVLEELN